MDQACLVKITDAGFILLRVYELGSMQKELGQYLVILTSSLVNNNYLITESEVVTGKSQAEALPY